MRRARKIRQPFPTITHVNKLNPSVASAVLLKSWRQGPHQRFLDT